MNDPAQLRRTYERDALTESSIAATWLEQLRLWFDDAGRPALRTVLAKAIDERGVTFYTNYGSAKGRDLDARPYAAAQFLWLAHERQVRLTGSVQRVAAQETEAYFHTRPRGSQLGAWASPQSQVIASRAVLEQRLAEAESRFGDGEIPVPPQWGGFLLAPDSVEFWQGRADRLHDRLRFRLDSGSWMLERLAP